MKISAYKIILMILSVILSSVVWLYVMFVMDVDGRATVREIKVNLEGQETLASRGLSVIYCRPEITLTFIGRRTDLVKLDKNTVSVSLDVSDVISPNRYARSHTEINYPEGFNASSVAIEYTPAASQIDFLVDKTDTKVVPVRINSNINVIEGYTYDPPIADPSAIRVNGPETILDSISYAEIWLDERDIDRTVERQMRYTLMDADGEKIEVDSRITLDCLPQEINVTVPVHKTKTVMLDVEIRDGGGVSADDVSYRIEPESIVIKGDAAVLEGINSLLLRTIELSRVMGSRSFDVIIPLPNDCENLSGENVATVYVEITGVQARALNVTNIDYINAEIPEGHDINFVTKSMTVSVRGPESLVEAVEPYNVRVVADLAGLTLAPGQMTVPAAVYIDGFGNRVGAVNDNRDYSVTLEIAPIRDDENGEPDDEP
ncbi:MAG: CdaR family protein [Oscillospiraceae bacterium]|nr:CdaR family protein [Oscillospiraceae bacterium]